jgi:hypothetical protein
MAFAAGFTELNVAVIGIANLSDGCVAFLPHKPDFT